MNRPERSDTPTNDRTGWFLVKSNGKTVYHSRLDHNSGYRLSARHHALGTPTPWTWTVYGDEHDRRPRTFKMGRGAVATWAEARRAAEAYAEWLVAD